MISIRTLAAALVIASLSVGLSGCATSSPAPAAHSEAAEQVDTAVLDKALESFSATGYRGLTPHVPALRAALDRAPAHYPVIEQRPGGATIVRSEDMAEGLMLLLLASELGKEGGGKDVVQTRNVYPTIALLLTSDAVERNDNAAALAYADRGLSMQPDHEMLLLEKGAALQGLGRYEEALAIADKALAEDGGLRLTFEPAPFHRRRGFSLIELNRLEEAKAAYLKSMETEPDNATAKQELAYIGQLMAGGKKTGSVAVNPSAPTGQR